MHPGTNFDDTGGKWDNDGIDLHDIPANVDFDPETQTYFLTDVGRAIAQQEQEEQANPERRSG
jgi:hypothetical protein